MSGLVEVRCPTDFGRLFTRLRTTGETVPVTSDNWMQFSCSDCRREYRRQGRQVRAVYHYYAFDGSFVRTVVETVRD